MTTAPPGGPAGPRAPELVAPRTPGLSRRRGKPGSAKARTNFELYAWVFMRVSGLLLFFLVLGHLFIMNILDGGVQRVNFGFVAGRWASPFWRTWDLVMLLLAELHGTNGLRTIINDYAGRPQTRFWLKTLLYTSAFLVVALGTLVIFTFDPDI
ncbi:succinate dehydrogenase [Frankia sp. CcI156]|jgi:succinate dehydrogenase / fumarate reductase membrane anchor subunit|uniref:Succinate dehydrogenase subunit D n=1 Tax=Frankia casuarinae (strain DSM 45818 / CECT 9043 / HFP020203 / CcI3) TaxID=106370 RepID=Q2JF78_FRACC|nr:MULTISPECIES: succinate dehydrogenase hydrophobic membrane anchor subunit [Frankia]ABD10064.1 succinate dehydrogenase subunit D [Frankia casuarinae]ETA04086.1 succinate dehydrogenase subunit D [Frankia sp. CcI6]EYT94071.1 succinate dehydrogenase subunit D [Frankia casuarinae]KDA44696.1 succinate dehydrogenase subunit D [Frankia sp. BMG5.23]KEZ38565.1 succinate dehydrogenase subunit D [Frankia sp. CeD]